MGHRDLLDAIAHPGDLTHLLEVLPQATPAAGSQLATVTVPGGEVWRLKAFTFLFTASAVVANRNFALRVTDGTNLVVTICGGGNVAASATNVRVSFYDNQGANSAAATGNGFTIPLGNLVLPTGYQISLFVQNLDAGDTILSPVLWVESLSTQPFGVRQIIAEGYEAQLAAPYLDNSGGS